MHFSLIAFAAQRFIFVCRTQLNLLVASHFAVTDVGKAAAAHTDGMDFHHLVGNGTQIRHWAKRLTHIVHIKSCHNHADALLCQPVADTGKILVEELRLVDADDIAVAAQEQDAGRVLHRCRWNRHTLVGHHIVVAVARVDGWLKDFHLLMGKLSSFHAAYQLFRLARKHAAANHFHSASVAHLSTSV